MTTPAEDLQAFVVARLAASAGVTDLIAERLYDQAPPDAIYPYATFGPSDFSFDDDVNCVLQQFETLQIDVWTRNDGRMVQCRAITNAIGLALQRADADLTTHGLSTVIASGRVFKDPDGITAHGVVSITAEIEVT